MEVSRDHEHFDWDAAWDALVARLRPPRYLRFARAAVSTVAALTVMVAAGWMLVHLVVQPFTELGRPWL